MIKTIGYYLALVLAIFSVLFLFTWLTVYESVTWLLLITTLVYLSINIGNLIWPEVQVIPKEMIDAKNKAVLITGCDTGFGNKLAQRLAHYGFYVFAGCLEPEGSGANQLRKNCRNNVKVLKLDVTSDEDVKSAIKIVEDGLKGRSLWAIVNNAGILISTEIEMGDMTSFTKQMEVNCLGTIRVTKGFVPLIRSSGSIGGRVINVGSIAGRHCIPGMVAYSVSKAAVISFSEGLRRELKKWSIDVITIEPHLFKTNLTNDQVQKKWLDEAWKVTPDSVKLDYGQDYLEGYQKFLNIILDSARPQVEAVVDTMVIAVTHSFVSPAYRVMGHLERIRVALYDYLPVRLLDLISHHLATIYTGKPALGKPDKQK
ncbi:estradiol 17-beta-dehydrogenase 2-like [Panonychus citri]|uniref:estradiol 17-beta-dehydrogenase 2-like n=1 Tax=Panonychus citri TaxID=50023 RepID=UPI002307867E|nr:estradiol 17-beta-dehydrogenase 2-like [Panonychus citri]